MCEETCAKYDDCVPDPEVYGECIVAECIDNFRLALDEPCFVERVELGRCWIERESCDEFFDTFLDTRPGSVCYDFVLASRECGLDHLDD
jgi:hypothetical protein